MSDNVINFRLARKAKARADKEQTAEQNRARFGLPKAEKARQKLEKQQAKSLLDGAKLTDGDDI